MAAFLCKRAQAADGASEAAARAALCGMLGRIEDAAAATEGRGGTRRAGVYEPRRGKIGGSLEHYSQRLREEVVRQAVYMST